MHAAWVRDGVILVENVALLSAYFCALSVACSLLLLPLQVHFSLFALVCSEFKAGGVWGELGLFIFRSILAGFCEWHETWRQTHHGLEGSQMLEPRQYPGSLTAVTKTP